MKLVQVVHVEGTDTIAEAQAIDRFVDALLLDSGRPDAATKTLGGTGRTHNWEVSRQIVVAVSCPVFLAGGLRPDNVGQAIAAVRPYGVDLCTGVRAEGGLDAVKLAAFVGQVGGARP